MNEEKNTQPKLESLNKAVDLALQYPTQTERTEAIGEIDDAMLRAKIEIAEKDEIFVQPILERVNRLALEKNIPATELLDLLVISARGLQEQAEKAPMPSEKTVTLAGLPKMEDKQE